MPQIARALRPCAHARLGYDVQNASYGICLRLNPETASVCDGASGTDLSVGGVRHLSRFGVRLGVGGVLAIGALRVRGRPRCVARRGRRITSRSHRGLLVGFIGCCRHGRPVPTSVRGWHDNESTVFAGSAAPANGYGVGMGTWAFVSVLAFFGVALSGCGTTEGAGARATAFRYVNAISSGDRAQACHLLAPKTRAQLEQSAGKPCPAALAEEDLHPAGALRSSATFGTMAQVRFADDTVFVTRFVRGWRVVASGCTAVPDQPYDCVLGGD